MPFPKRSVAKKFLEEVYANIQNNFNWTRNRRDIDDIAKRIGEAFGLSCRHTNYSSTRKANSMLYPKYEVTWRRLKICNNIQPVQRLC